LLAGTGAKGFAGDGGAAASAKFNNPTGLALDVARNALYVADTGNHRIRKIDLTTGNISTVAGNGVAALGAAGQATSVPLNSPEGVAVDAAGNIYIADTGNNRVCKVASGQLTIIAGTGEVGTTGDGGAATAAKLNHPTGVAVTSDGASVYIVDQENHRIRKVAGGTLTGIAGTGAAGFGGDGGLAASAQFNAPTGIALDAGGNLLITDSDNERIRRITISDGKIATIAGNGTAGNGGDGGNAGVAMLDTPTAIAVDTSGGTVVFCDTGNLRSRRLNASGPQNNPPVPATVANQSLNKNQQLNVALSATDADNDPVTFTLVPPLAFVSITNASPAGRTATLFINPNNSNAGVYNVQVKADDGKGGSNLTAVFTITVNDPNSPPVNQPPVAVANQLPASVVAQDGQNATVHLDGSGSSDPNGDPLTYSWKDNGQQIATTAVADVPLSVGQHSIVLTVNDGKGGTNSTAAQTVTITAPPTPTELTIDTVTPNNGKRGTTVTVVITGTGFTPQSVVAVNSGGVTVTILNQTSTQLTTKFAISSITQASTRSISITNANGTSVTKSTAFTIKQ
jgi:sugar lactone lactonase YvrE